MGIVVVLAWFLSVLVAMSIMRARAGTGWWYGMQVFGSDGFGPVFAVKIVVLSLVWPVTLAVWLMRGQPEPRVVFNEKAVERRMRAAA